VIADDLIGDVFEVWRGRGGVSDVGAVRGIDRGARHAVCAQVRKHQHKRQRGAGRGQQHARGDRRAGQQQRQQAGDDRGDDSEKEHFGGGHGLKRPRGRPGTGVCGQRRPIGSDRRFSGLSATVQW